MKFLLAFILALCILIACTKKVGKNPELAYSNRALLDSINLPNLKYYKNNPGNLVPGTNGPHGPYKLRFNDIGYNALTDDGKLPVGGAMPNGSLIVKDIYNGNNNISL